MKKAFNSYRGTLTPAQIVEGTNAACANAKRLLHDAKLMFESDRYPTAVALSILSIEESGKVPILRLLSLANTQESAISKWKEYRSHTSNNVLWSFPSFAAKGARTLEEFKPLFDEHSEDPVSSTKSNK
ncbi:MAG: AbiV family abortive infection protein [Dehalococcoidales bacterium]|nr:AbiV family abortive infection protein [Dehalococcoidales bacterium]